VETKSLFKALAAVMAMQSVFMAICMIVGLVAGEGIAVTRTFGLPVAAGFLSLTAAMFSLRPGRKPVLSHRTGYLFVSLAWVFSAALGALPFILSSSVPAYPAAYFETMSGFTTTGASILTDIESLPRSLLLWRATTHWLGGMGIVVLTVALLPLLGLNGRALMEAEAPGPSVDKISPRLSQTAKILWLLYLGLTVIEIVLLLFGGMSLFDATTHAFATMATGGFSTRNASVAAFGSAYVDIVITVFMLLAGMNFSLFWRLLQGDVRATLRDTEFRAYAGIFLAAAGIMVFDLWRAGSYDSVGSAARFASFQAASILTTTGFVTADYLQWPALSQAMLFVLMFIGGCAGSTGGGVKVSRIVTMLKMGVSEMRYLLNPRGVYGVFVGGRYLKKNIVYDIAAMVFLYLVTAFISVIVVATGGFDIMTSLTATMACLGNIGPGFGLVGPVFNYSFLPDYLLWWLSFMMLLGRLEVYTVLVLFTSAFWRR
jgi:trk system potassium uptake protein TrkH